MSLVDERLITKVVFTPALLNSDQKKVHRAEFLSWCEYKPVNYGAEKKTAGLKPRQRGFGSLPNQPWPCLVDV